VFDERGYHAARVDDIVKVARMSHGTFYLYFANKEDLFRGLAQDWVAAMDALAGELGSIDPGPDGYEALRQWLARFVDTYRRHGPVIRAWAEAQLDSPDLARLGSASMNALASRIADRIAEGNGDVDPRHAAVALVAMVERLNYYLLSRAVPIDDEAVRDTLATIVHLGMFEGEPGR